MIRLVDDGNPGHLLYFSISLKNLSLIIWIIITIIDLMTSRGSSEIYMV